MRILVACECSGRVRRALAARGHEVWSVDLDLSEDQSRYHIIGDALDVAYDARPWDMMIAHPPCTYLANSGVRWLYDNVPCRSSHESTFNDDVMRVRNEARFKQMVAGAKFFADLMNAPIPKIACENPVMHGHAKNAIAAQMGLKLGEPLVQHFVQPWWFGDPAFKATGFTLKGLPPLVKPSTALVPPKPGTDEHKAWSAIHRMSPGPARAKNRSRTFPGIANAIAQQWG